MANPKVRPVFEGNATARKSAGHDRLKMAVRNAPGRQRLCFTIGASTKTVLEVGIDNLTKDEAPLWVHFTENGSSQAWLLVRLESPEPVPDGGS